MTAISDFDIFARVARTGNMSAPGERWGLSPAVVSKRISLLEEGWARASSNAPHASSHSRKPARGYFGGS